MRDALSPKGIMSFMQVLVSENPPSAPAVAHHQSPKVTTQPDMEAFELFCEHADTKDWPPAVVMAAAVVTAIVALRSPAPTGEPFP